MKPTLIPDIRTNIKALAEQLIAVAAKLMEAHDMLGSGGEEPPQANGHNGARKPQPVAQNGSGTLSRATVFYDVLKAHGSKMHRKDILAAAVAKGSLITKVDTATVYMKGDKRFHRIGSGEWGLAEWSKPA